jgi:hypothetical protein
MPISAFTDVANCECVVDSANQYTDAGVTVAAVDGAQIQQLNDTSGSARHWTNTGTAGSRPTSLLDPELGVRVLNFTGPSNQLINLPNFLAAFTQHTILWVLKAKHQTTPNANEAGLHFFSTHGDVGYPWTDGNIYDDCGVPLANAIGTAPARPLTMWSVAHSIAATDDFRWGTDRCTKAATNTSWTYLPLSTTPAFGNGNARWFNGYLRLCVIYSRVLTDAEFDDVCALIEDSYLARASQIVLLKNADKPLQWDDQLVGGDADFAQLIQPFASLGVGGGGGGGGGGAGRPTSGQMWPRGKN